MYVFYSRLFCFKYFFFIFILKSNETEEENIDNDDSQCLVTINVLSPPFRWGNVINQQLIFWQWCNQPWLKSLKCPVQWLGEHCDVSPHRKFYKYSDKSPWLCTWLDSVKSLAITWLNGKHEMTHYKLVLSGIGNWENLPTASLIKWFYGMLFYHIAHSLSACNLKLNT